MITLHFHLQLQFKYELFHIYNIVSVATIATHLNVSRIVCVFYAFNKPKLNSSFITIP